MKQIANQIGPKTPMIRVPTVGPLVPIPSREWDWKTRINLGPCLLLLLLAALGTVTASAQQPSFLTKGLVAHYPFDGSANDASGSGNHLPGNLTTTSDRFGGSGAGLFTNPTQTLTTTLIGTYHFNKGSSENSDFSRDHANRRSVIRNIATRIQPVALRKVRW